MDIWSCRAWHETSSQLRLQDACWDFPYETLMRDRPTMTRQTWGREQLPSFRLYIKRDGLALAFNPMIRYSRAPRVDPFQRFAEKPGATTADVCKSHSSSDASRRMTLDVCLLVLAILGGVPARHAADRWLRFIRLAVRPRGRAVFLGLTRGRACWATQCFPTGRLETSSSVSHMDKEARKGCMLVGASPACQEPVCLPETP